MNGSIGTISRAGLCALVLCWHRGVFSAAETAQSLPGSGSLGANDRPGFHWQHSETSLALLTGQRVVWQFNFKREPGKPCFHPLALTDGTVLTGFRPPDHPWQRALFFSWKYLNHVNYWEEDKNGVSQGQTEIQDVSVTPSKDFSAQLQMALAYHPHGQPSVLTERRLIKVSPPDKAGCYRIDWRSEFTAGNQEVLLDRTPPLGQLGGQSWGGYAGLTVRFADTIRDWQINNSEGQRGKEQTNGKSARWYDLSGDFRGDTAEHHTAGIAILDHPTSMRHPTPWQVNTSEPIHFAAYMPSFLFHAPYTIPPRGKIRLCHRVLIHPGWLDKSLLEQEWSLFKATPD